MIRLNWRRNQSNFRQMLQLIIVMKTFKFNYCFIIFREEDRMKKNVFILKAVVIGIIILLVISSFGATALRNVNDTDSRVFLKEESSHDPVILDENLANSQIKNLNYDRRYAVLAVGKYYGSQQSYTWFLKDVQRLYWTLAIKQGFDEDDIYVLVTLEDDLEEPEIFDPGIIDYESTEENLQLVLNNLKNVMNEDDLFFFCIIDHGNSNGFELYSDWVTADEFAGYVNGIPGELIFILQPCGSGGLIDELSGENRIIGTSVKADESEGSWMGKFTMGLIFLGDIDEEIGNQDGNVSIEEAHHYAARYVYENYGVHSLIDDNADKVGHHYTSNGYDIDDPSKDAYIAARTFLGGETTSNPPGKPDTPSGPTSGEPGVKYPYNTNAMDPEDDPIMYGWDWDGDLEVDGWTRPFNSGMEITSKHKWDVGGTYEIRVKAMDIHGAKGVWSDPLTVTIFVNNPPEVPDIDGPTIGVVGISYDYTFVSIDPNGDDIAEYIIDWGDENGETITGPFLSGEEVIASHIWNKRDTYTIRARAKDVHDAMGPWGTLTVKIPRNKIIDRPSLQILQNHLHMFPLLNYLLGL